MEEHRRRLSDSNSQERRDTQATIEGSKTFSEGTIKEDKTEIKKNEDFRGTPSYPDEDYEMGKETKPPDDAHDQNEDSTKRIEVRKKGTLARPDKRRSSDLRWKITSRRTKTSEEPLTAWTKSLIWEKKQDHLMTLMAKMRTSSSRLMIPMYRTRTTMDTPSNRPHIHLPRTKSSEGPLMIREPGNGKTVAKEEGQIERSQPSEVEKDEDMERSQPYEVEEDEEMPIPARTRSSTQRPPNGTKSEDSASPRQDQDKHLPDWNLHIKKNKNTTMNDTSKNETTEDLKTRNGTALAKSKNRTHSFLHGPQRETTVGQRRREAKPPPRQRRDKEFKQRGSEPRLHTRDKPMPTRPEETKYNKGCKATEEFAFWTRIWRERNEDFKEIKKEENKGKSIHSMKLE